MNPGLGRMDPLQQRVEVEAVIAPVGDHDLPVDDRAGRQGPPQRLEQLGEVPGEWLELAREELDPIAVTEHDAAEPVPLRLEQPLVVARRDLARQFGEHRLERRLVRQVPRHDGFRHRASLAHPDRSRTPVPKRDASR